MLKRGVVWVIATVIGLAIFAGCISSIPPASQFQIPAVGTPMPGGHEEAVRPDLPPEVGGALFVNQTGYQLQVAVNNTIATIPISNDFLFILPPGTHDFYVYQPNVPPRLYTEKLEGGKMRYVYWFPQSSR